MKFEYHKGDLLASDETVLAHGCNTHGVMSAGIAKAFSRRYQGMFWAYVEECKQRRFVPGTAMCYRYLTQGDNRIIFNLGTQDEPGPHARFEWVYLSFRNMAEQMIALDLNRVAIPKIGCGIGGLAWEGLSGVEAWINEALADTEIIRGGSDLFTVAVYEL